MAATMATPILAGLVSPETNPSHFAEADDLPLSQDHAKRPVCVEAGSHRMRADLAKTIRTVPRTRFDALKTRSAEVMIRFVLLTEPLERRFLMASVPIALRVSTAGLQAGLLIDSFDCFQGSVAATYAVTLRSRLLEVLARKIKTVKVPSASRPSSSCPSIAALSENVAEQAQGALQMTDRLTGPLSSVNLVCRCAFRHE